MRLAVSIPLIVCLVTSTLPLEAQGRMESTHRRRLPAASRGKPPGSRSNQTASPADRRGGASVLRKLASRLRNHRDHRRCSASRTASRASSTSPSLTLWRYMDKSSSGWRETMRPKSEKSGKKGERRIGDIWAR